MQVLLEVIPDVMAINGQEKSIDYEAFTISGFQSAEDVFQAELRKLSLQEDVDKLDGFFGSTLVRKAIRTATNWDRSFRILDCYVPCGNYGFTYRLSPYIAGKHSR